MNGEDDKLAKSIHSMPPPEKAVEAWASMAESMVEVVRRSSNTEKSVLAAARQVRIAGWVLVAVVVAASVAVLREVRSSNAIAATERAAQRVLTDKVREEVRAAIEAQAKRQAAVAARQEAEEASSTEAPPKRVEERKEVAAQLEVEAARAELKAVRVLPITSPKVIEQLEKRASPPKGD